MLLNVADMQNKPTYSLVDFLTVMLGRTGLGDQGVSFMHLFKDSDSFL